jgi:ADP-ribose pyrophosphatase YjhB (NUDIX family)
MCPNNCCNLSIKPYCKKPSFFDRRIRRQKAGVFIYDPLKDKVLLIQSRGNLWGPPKGTLDRDETYDRCAIREVKEETGLDVDQEQFLCSISIRNKAVYYFIKFDECDVSVQDHIYGNDANGIGWVKIDCLNELIRDGKITLNSHCKIAFQRFLNVSFSN